MKNHIKHHIAFYFRFLRETKAIMSSRIPRKWHHSLSDIRNSLENTNSARKNFRKNRVGFVTVLPVLALIGLSKRHII